MTTVSTHHIRNVKEKGTATTRVALQGSRVGFLSRLRLVLLGAFLLLLSSTVQAQFTFTTNNGAITVSGYDCSGGDVVLPSTFNGMPVTSIGNYAFWACGSLTNVTIPSSVTNIGNAAFAICVNLTNVTMGGGVKTIGDHAFYHCNSLTNFTIPSSVTSIGKYSFKCDNLIMVTIGSGVTNMAHTAFSECPRLIAVGVHTNNPSYSSLDGVLFDKSQSSLICFPGGKTGSYTVPSTVSSIGDSAFIYTVLTNVVIGGSITDIGSAAFLSSSLVSVTISNGVKSIGATAFASCTNLGSVTIPNSVTNVGYAAFHNCTDLTSATLGDGITTIKQGVFEACYSLATITIPASVTNIEIVAFSYCHSLTSIYFQGNAPHIDDYFVFYNHQGAIAYYLPGTTGWDDFAVLGDISTGLWVPRMETNDGSFGVKADGFGFNISWASGQNVVVEACTNLLNPEWQPLQTNTLTGASAYFSDSHWINYPGRLYRVRSP
ncbi:MAG: leucine-rich repeat domain-containing protein [Verrucomicrobia bacterium]|nr:leucine-rich repeat domain-containing protein [Verrucomicrobiota bacterium]